MYLYRRSDEDHADDALKVTRLYHVEGEEESGNSATSKQGEASFSQLRFGVKRFSHEAANELSGRRIFSFQISFEKGENEEE